MSNENNGDSGDAQTAEELLAEGGGTRRTATDAPEAKAEDDGGEPDVQTAIKQSLEAIDDDSVNIHLQFYDRSLTALLRGVEDAGQLEDLIDRSADELGRDDSGKISRANALSLLVRVGVKHVDDSLIEDATAAQQQYAKEQAGQF